MKKLLRKLTAVVSAAVVALAGVNGGALTPTLADGKTPVYLLEIANDSGADIIINGTAYPTNHNGEKKIYAYLPAKTVTKPNFVVVGTETTKYIYDNSKWLIVPTVTAPTPNELVYTGEEQTLVTEGTTSGGTMVYSLAEDGMYTTAIPTGEDAATYTVWYKSKDGEVYADTLPASVDVTIAQASPVITNANTVKNHSTVYGSGEFVAPTAAVEGTFEYKAGQTTYTAEMLKTYLASKNVSDSPVEVEYTFTPTDTTNYKEVTGTISFTIEKAGSSVGTAPKAKENLTYDGTAQALVDAGSASGGTMMYSTSRTGTYSEDIPTGTDAKQYSVWYRVVGDDNHSDTTPVEIKATIAPLTITNENTTITLGTALTYTGAVQTAS